MSASENKLAEVLAKIASAPPEQIHLYSAWIGIRHLRAEVEEKAVLELLWQMTNVPRIDVNDSSSICEAHDCAHKFSHSFVRLAGGHAELGELARIRVAIEVLEAHPGLPAASALLEPLCAQRDELRAAVEAERRAHQAAHAAADEAHRLATEKALAAAEQDAEVIKSRRALAAFENPEVPLVRGRQKLEASPA